MISLSTAGGPYLGGAVPGRLASTPPLPSSAPLPALGNTEAWLLPMQRPGTDRYTVRDDPTRAAALASEYKAAIKAAVMVTVPPRIAGGLLWSKSTYPSLDNPELIASTEVAGLGLLSSTLKQFMFLDDTKATQPERSDGV